MQKDILKDDRIRKALYNLKNKRVNRYKRLSNTIGELLIYNIQKEMDKFIKDPKRKK